MSCPYILTNICCIMSCLGVVISHLGMIESYYVVRCIKVELVMLLFPRDITGV